MVPLLSALFIMEPLSLPYQSEPCNYTPIWKPSTSQKRNFPSCSLCSQFTASQKASAFCSPMQNKWKPSTAFPVDGFSTVFYRNGITIYGAKPKARPRIFVCYAHYMLATLAKFGPPSRARRRRIPSPARLVIASLRSL